MNTLRWLLKNPLALAWVLAGLAILLNLGAGGHEAQEAHEKHEKAEKSPVADKADKADKHEGKYAGHEAQAVVAQTDQDHAAQPAQAAKAEVVNATDAKPAAAEPVKPEVLLVNARKAYWDNAFSASEAAYKALLQQQPDSLEYKGELANLYWKQGKTKEASQLFVEIAPQLAAKGRTAEALNMKLYVDMVDAELAKKIDAELKK